MARRGGGAWRTRRPAGRSRPAAARTAGRTRPASRPAPARVLSALGATPADSATSRRSMSTNRPDSGRFDQSALAVTWNSTIRPAPRVAWVTSGVPSASVAQVCPARSARRLGQHLPVDLHLVRHGQAGERRAGAERRQPGRLAPGQRAAKLPVAAEQLHRQQRVGLADRLFGGARAGEADQQAALLHPARSARRAPAPAGSGRSARISTDSSRCSRVARSASRTSVNGVSARRR